MSLSVVVWKDPAENISTNIIENYQPNFSYHTPNGKNSKSRIWALRSETATPHPATLSMKNPLVNLEVENHQFLADLLNFQTSCDHPAMKNMIEYILKLKCEASQAKIEKAELENFISEHSSALFQDIAKDLYEQIKSSPRLTQRLKQQESNNVEIKELIQKLEMPDKDSLKKLCNEWTWIEHEKEPITVDLDLVGLEELQQQIALLEKASRSSDNPQQFFLDIEEVRKATQIKANFHLGKTLYKAGSLTWQMLQGIYYGVTLLRSAAPTVLCLAPFILPIGWLGVIQFLLRVFV